MTVRIELPVHLRTLAGAGREIAVTVERDAEGSVSLAAVLDALESRYPVLRGTIRDHGTLRRRPFIRFFACEQDLSHASPDDPLPDAVARGDEPLLVIGAMAGG
jgi:hypothetical protein